MTVLLTAILVSACLGALVGLIRQWGDQQGAEPGEFAGVRTHTLWAVLGCLAAHLNGIFPYALAVAAACTVMLPRVLAALTVINPAFARTLLVPFALMALPGVVYMAWVWRRAQQWQGRGRRRAGRSR